MMLAFPILPAAALVLAAACSPSSTSDSPDCPGGDDMMEPSVPPEVDGRLAINELMVSNVLTAVDEEGFAADWIELYNPGNVDVSLTGYGVTNDLREPRKHVIGAGVTVPAGGYLELWLDQQPERGTTHLCLEAEKDGGELGLARPDGSYIDRIAYGAQATDFSAARVPDGSDSWQIEWHASPGAPNPEGDGEPVGLEDTSSPPEEVPAAGDLTEYILEYDTIHELELVVEPEHAASLESDPRTYVPGHMVFDGRRYGPVGVRLKGQNSFLPFSQKPSLRLNINEYAHGARFFGLKDMTLNNMAEDFSMMHERLAYRVARDFDVPASRANHIVLTVNGEHYGLYTQIESMKEKLIGRWFEDPTGPLYDGLDVDFVEELINNYELQDGPDDRTLLFAVAEALRNPDPDAAIDAARAGIDLDQFLRFWAMTSVVGQFDSMPYSDPGDDYFVYADPGTGKLFFLPWGMDETFYSAELDVTEISSVLARTCKESPACFQAYADACWRLLDQLETMNWEAEHARIKEQIAPHVTADTRKPYTNAMVVEFQGQMGFFISDRRFWLEQMLPPPSGR
jgi:hypothetical protein